MDIRVTLPEDLYTRLVAIAAQRGQSAEGLLREAATQIVSETQDTPSSTYVDDVYVEGYDPYTDPLAPFVGIFASDDPGWIERHDAYFAGVEKKHGDEK